MRLVVPLRIFDEDAQYLCTEWWSQSRVRQGDAFQIIDPRKKQSFSIRDIRLPTYHALTVLQVHVYGVEEPVKGEPWRGRLHLLGVDCQVSPHRTPIRSEIGYARLQHQYFEVLRTQLMHVHADVQCLGRAR